MIKNVQLVFDCAEPDDIMRFWGRALRYKSQFAAMTPEELSEWRKGFPQFDGKGRMDDEDGRRMPIYCQKVPEAKSGRNRLRPEISVPDATAFTDDVRNLGGEVTDDLCVDIEGNEFSIVEADGDVRLSSIVIDALDPERMLAFWSDATGYVVSGDRCDPPPGAKYVLPFTDGAPRTFDLVPGLRFVQTDEPKRAKNRLHLDVHVADAPAWRQRLVDAGAVFIGGHDEFVLADPDGNELCVN